MKIKFTSIFKKNIDPKEDYTSLSVFFLRASFDEKKKVITEAAQKANEDQAKLYKEAMLKSKSN